MFESEFAMEPPNVYVILGSTLFVQERSLFLFGMSKSAHQWLEKTNQTG